MIYLYGFQILGPVNQSLTSLAGGGSTSSGITDHGDLTGLSGDDHSQYLLTGGTRQLTGNWNFGSFDISGTGDVYCTDAHLTGDVFLAAGKKLVLGNGSDADIYHNNNDLYIDQKNTSGEIWIRQDTQNGLQTSLRVDDQNRVSLYYGGSIRMQTHDDGVYMIRNTLHTGNYGCWFGPYVYYLNCNGSTGRLSLDSATDFRIVKHSGQENIARFIKDGGVELYYNNIKKFETNYDGVSIDGILETVGDISTQSDLHVVNNATISGTTTTSGVNSTIIGTAAAPAYSFDEYTNAGMYYIPGDRALAFSIDGQELIQLDRYGNVGIGMNQDTYRTRPFANLHVYNNGPTELRVEGRIDGAGDSKIWVMSGNASSSKAVLELSKHSNMGGGGAVFLYHEQSGSPSKTFNIGSHTGNHYFRMLEYGDGLGNQVGYIGIGGVDDPQEPLHVGGNIKADGTVSGTHFYGDGSNLTGINHDSLDGFVADEHIDWKSTNQNLVTTGNITGNSIYCGSYLRSTNAPNCQIRYASNNTFEFYCGNKTYMIMNAYGDLVINEGGYNNNGLRCESNNNANMLKVDPVNDRVGIGDGTPSYALDVAGDVRATGTYRSSDGTAGASGWYDDGANFRVTVKNGLITNIGTTVSGGYSMS